jgi:hypothetical protein
MPLPYIGPIPASSTDLTTKNYVDAAASGLALSTVTVWPNASGDVTIFDSSIISTSNVVVVPAPYSDTDQNTPELDPFILAVGSVANGSFDIEVIPVDPKQKIVGPIKLMYFTAGTSTSIATALPGTVTITVGGSMVDGAPLIPCTISTTGGQLSRWAPEGRLQPSTRWVAFPEVVATGSPQYLNFSANSPTPSSGTWDFRVRARNSSGYSAAYSNVVTYSDTASGG